MSTGHYGLNGEPISMDEWVRLAGSREKILKQETLPNGRWVSTVWLGLDYNFGGGVPLIFETMVFPSNNVYGELDCERYSSHDQALAGHAEMVKKWSVDTPEDNS